MSPDKPVVLMLGRPSPDLDTLASALAEAFRVSTAPSVESFTAHRAEQRPELMILDLAHPEAAAPALIEGLSADADTAVLLLASPGGEVEAARMLERGALDLLTRPVLPVVARARAAGALASGRHRNLLRRMAFLDPVTGLANLPRFEQSLDQEWRRHQRQGASLALLLLELDHFRTFEGRFGKVRSDETLVRVADAMSSGLLRGGDLLARLEAGRFACLLPETDTIGAVAVGERMRAEVRTLGIAHPDSRTEPVLTLSGGVGTRIPAPPEEAEALLLEAEHRLTQAKARGRNQVFFGAP